MPVLNNRQHHKGLQVNKMSLLRLWSAAPPPSPCDSVVRARDAVALTWGRPNRSSPLPLTNLIEEEPLHGFVRQAQRGRLFHRPVHIPAIDERPFHEPHPGGSAPARSMDERRGSA